MNLGFVAVNSGDYNLAKTCFDAATAANPNSLDAKLGLAVSMRGLKDYKGAAKLYDEIIASDPQYEAAYFNAATLNYKFEKDFVKAQKYVDAFVASRSGSIDPNHEVFKLRDSIVQAKAAEDERKRIEEEKRKAEEEKKRRDEELLTAMATTIATTKAKLEANAQCLDPSSVEEVSMILEQAQVVVDEKDTTMAGDIQTLLDAYVPAVDEALAGCESAVQVPAPGAAPEPAAPADPAAPMEPAEPAPNDPPADGEPTP